MAQAAALRAAPASIDTQPIGRKPEVNEGDVKLIQRLTARLVQMDQVRLSWWVHWRELAAFILPRRYRYLVTPNQNNRGVPLNTAILDSTATVDARILAAGMMAGTASPARPWFRLTSPDDDVADDWDAKIWYAEVTKRMLRVMATSNYYLAKGVQYVDEVVFGTAPMIIYEDNEKVIRCYNPVAGEYYCAVGADFTVNTLGRKFTMTVQQLVDEFGLDQVSPSVRQMWDSAGGNLDTEVIVLHLIEPNPDYVADDMHIGPGGVPRHFRYREFYWEMAGGNTFLRKRGYFEKPFSCPRWDVTGNDPYGRSPGMDALGDVKQLQLEQRRKAQAIDKQVNPPMVADVQLKNQPASLLPGGITYVSGVSPGFRGFEPAIKIEPRIAEMVEDIRECQKRIGDVFYVPLFLMISQLETVRTAAEIDARREEQLIQLGPVLERNEAEGLSPDVTRIFQIMARAGLFPPPPDSVRRRGLIKVEYVASLTQAQRATGLTAIERQWAFVGSVAQAMPDVIDIMNADESVREYGDLIQIPPKLLNPARVVQQKRQKRQEQQAMQAAQAMAQQAVEGAQTLSETPVGAGQSALQMMLGNGAIGRPG